jgi:A/G-specific adenine glycosylase
VPSDHAELRRDLLAWFARCARDLPWRRTRDAYAIWISEAMLQQTRVEVVEPYFARFMARFPTVAELAAASEDEVAAAWSGLGYYRRARALRAAAGAIVERHGGRFPDTPAEARRLPGVGPYTAGAVLSIAYGVRAPVVDGNVARVFARWFALEQPLGSPALARELWGRAEELLPPETEPPGAGPGAWNQALMELGALVCAPRGPRCAECPVERHCRARREGRVRELPRPAPRRTAVDVRLEVALVESGGRALLVRRPAGGRMAGLWELPTREVAGPAGGVAGLWPPEFGLLLREREPRGEVTHSITHHRIRARVRVAELFEPAPPGAAWASAAEAAELPLTGMARKILRRCAAGGRETRAREPGLFALETPAADE